MSFRPNASYWLGIVTAVSLTFLILYYMGLLQPVVHCPLTHVRAPRLPTLPPYTVILVPNRTVCHTHTAHRLGHTGEGGWTVCDWPPSTAPDCTVLSYGIRDDTSFDQAVLETSACEIHGFDPSLSDDGGYHQPPRQQFHRTGLGPDGLYPAQQAPFAWPGMDYLRQRNSEPWTLEQVSTLMLRHQWTHVDLLKVDVEGAEWFNLMDLLDHAHPHFQQGHIRQYVAEWHFPPQHFTVTGEPSEALIITQLSDYGATDGTVLPVVTLIRQLVEAGMDLWEWRYNESDKHCIEVSFISTLSLN